MIRVSPSLLESFRLFMTEDWMAVERMRDAITGDFTPSPQILLGLAYHHMLEEFTDTHEMYFNIGNPSDQEMLVTQDGYTFAYVPCIEPVADFLQAGCVHEVYGNSEIETRHGIVSVSTRADAVHGNIGGEWKTTEQSIQVAKYMDSVQWKLCCYALGLKAMDYRIVRLEQRPDSVWTVRESDAIQCVFSPSHMDEVIDLIDGLVEFHKAQGLEGYLVPRDRRISAVKAA